MSRSDAQTRSQTKEGSAPSSSRFFFVPSLLFFPLLVTPLRNKTGATTAAVIAQGEGTPMAQEKECDATRVPTATTRQLLAVTPTDPGRYTPIRLGASQAREEKKTLI